MHMKASDSCKIQVILQTSFRGLFKLPLLGVVIDFGYGSKEEKHDRKDWGHRCVGRMYREKC